MGGEHVEVETVAAAVAAKAIGWAEVGCAQQPLDFGVGGVVAIPRPGFCFVAPAHQVVAGLQIGDEVFVRVCEDKIIIQKADKDEVEHEF